MNDVIQTGIKITAEAQGVVAAAVKGKKSTDDLTKSFNKLNKTGTESKKVDDELSRTKKRLRNRLIAFKRTIDGARVAQKKNKQETKAATRASKAQERAHKRQGKQANKLSGIYRKLAGVMATLGVGKIIGGIVGVNSALENLEVRLTRTTGSASEANRLLDEMAGYAGKVAFKFEDIAEAGTSLSGIEDDVDELVKLLPIIGDLAAQSGLSFQDTQGQITRMFSAGAASADMFRERGTLAMLGFQTGVSYSAEETRKKVIEEWEKTGSKFRGTAMAMAGTWSGIMSMFGDRWTQFRKEVGDAGFFNFIKNEFSGLLNKIDEAFESGSAQAFAEFISNALIRTVQFLQSNIAQVKLGIELWKGALEEGGTNFTTLGGIASSALDIIVTSIGWVRDRVIELPVNIAALGAVFGHIMQSMGLAAQETWTNITTDAEIAWSTVKRAAEVAGEGISIFWREVTDEIRQMYAFMIDSFAAGADKLGFDDTAEGLRGYAQALFNTATGAEQARLKAVENRKEHEAMLVTLEKERAAIMAQIELTRIAGLEVLESTLAERDARLARIEVQREAIKKTLAEAKATALLKKSIDDKNTSQKKSTQTVKAQLTESQKFIKKLEDELSLMQFTGKELAVQTKLREAHAKGIKGQDTEIRKLIESMYDLKIAQKEAAKESTDEVAQIYEDAASNIYGSFRNMFRDIFDDGKDAFKNLGDSLLDIFKDILADMLTLAIAKPIIVPIVSSIGGALGLGGGQIQQVLGQIGGGTAGINPAAGAGAATGSTALGGYVQTAAGIAAGYGIGSSLGSTLGGSQGQSNTLAAVGSTVGAILGSVIPGIGTAIGAALGGIWGGVWSGVLGGGTSVEASGVNLGIANGQVTGESFSDIAKRRSLFRGSRRYTETQSLDAELQNALQGSIDAITGQLSSVADLFGINNNLDSFGLSNQRLDLTGLSEDEAQAVISEWLEGVSAEMAEHLFPGLERLQETGEALFDTLDRVTSQILTFKDAAASLDATISAINAKYLSTPTELLNDLETQFNDLFNQAQTASGEELVAIAAMMQQLAPALLEQSRSIYASGGPFHSLLNQVTDALAVVSSQLSTDAQDMIDTLSGNGSNINAPTVPAYTTPNDIPFYQPSFVPTGSTNGVASQPIVLEQTFVYVAPDGTELKREVKRELLEDSKRGETIIDAKGITGKVTVL